MILDRWVQFQRAANVAGGLGDEIVFADHGAPHPVAKKDMNAAERDRSGEVQAHVVTRFTLRWSPFVDAITHRDRILCEGKSYEITAIKDGHGRRQFIEITTSARAS